MINSFLETEWYFNLIMSDENTSPNVATNQSVSKIRVFFPNTPWIRESTYHLGPCHGRLENKRRGDPCCGKYRSFLKEKRYAQFTCGNTGYIHCAGCGVLFHKKNLVGGHDYPSCKGGRYLIFNIFPSCASCEKRVGSDFYSSSPTSIAKCACGWKKPVFYMERVAIRNASRN